MQDKRKEERIIFNFSSAPNVEFGVYFQGKINPRYYSLKAYDFSKFGFSIELSKEHQSGLKEEDTLFIKKIGDYLLKKMVIGKIRHFSRISFKDEKTDKLKKSYRAGIELSDPFDDEDFLELKKMAK